MPFIVAGMERIAAGIEDESDRQDFEVLYGAMIDDFYNEDFVDSTPVGTVSWFPLDAANIPAKWLICNGSAVSQATYPALYPLLRDNFGHGGGNFNLPDLRQRFLYGAGVDASIGDIGGSDTHTLTTAEMPAHTHIQQGRNTTGGAVFHSQINAVSTAAAPVATTTVTGSTGGGGAHNNMPPYMRGYWCIKALP